jgi:polysaccharide chain length determinant protein (PEP-CTERM system associated)
VIRGKQYQPEDYLLALWRRKWTIVVPFVVLALGTALVAHFLPNRYRSEALILVIPQRVPESYVRSAVTTKIEDRLQAVRQQILSRTRLEQIIIDNNLYADERREGIMEDVVERMRRDVDIQVIRSDAFRLAYIGRDPLSAMRVTERLASMTIEENVNERALLAEGTNQFLETQLENARRLLIEQEQKLEVFRKQHSGELPSQATANLQAIQNLQMQIQAVVESLNRDRDRRLIVNGTLSDLMSADVQQAVIVDPNAPNGGRTMTAQEQLMAAQAQLRSLEARFTPEHPDVVRAKRQVAELQRRAESEAMAAPLSPEAAPVVTPAQAARRDRVRALQLELESLDRQIASKQQQEQQLRSTAASYQARIEMVPARETELAELTRDYDTLQKVYADLLAKNQESKVAANLERRQIGEQFKLLDPARLPQRPISPNRPLIDLMGALIGLGLGVGLAAFQEYRDNSFRTEDEVGAVIGLPVLAKIPLMITAVDRVKQRRRRLVLSSAGVAVVFAAGAVIWKTGVLNELMR